MRTVIYHAVFRMYVWIRAIARATGLIRPLRKAVGPVVGQFVYRFSPNRGRPVEIDGHRFFLASPDRYPPLDMSMGRYEEETTKLVKSLIHPGMVVVDVGAHVGYFALLGARQVGPTGRVYAFEPEPVNHSLLIRNVELNRYQNITVVKKAVSNRVGSSTLYLSGLDSGRHSTYQHGLPERGSIAIETITLDAFLESEGWPRVDLVKVDVEGAEQDVLDGMSRLLEKYAGVKLILEFHPFYLRNSGVDPMRFLSRPVSPDFKVYCIDEAKGMVPIEELDLHSLIAGLMEQEISLNLFCSRS